MVKSRRPGAASERRREAPRSTITKAAPRARSEVGNVKGAPPSEVGNDKSLREILERLLAWEDAHVNFDNAVAGITPALRASQPAGLPYSPWQLVEHLRRTQHDILDFCLNANYQELNWPDDYWPADPAPPSPKAWEESIHQFQKDRQALQRLAADPAVDLAARIPMAAAKRIFASCCSWRIIPRITSGSSSSSAVCSGSGSADGARRGR